MTDISFAERDNDLDEFDDHLDKFDDLDKEKFDFVAVRNRTDAMIMCRLPIWGIHNRLLVGLS